jgi:D-3-phosphoglycerate dehydrogenase
MGHWNRESKLYHELDGKTVGIIGLETWKAFAKIAVMEVLCYDIQENGT